MCALNLHRNTTFSLKKTKFSLFHEKRVILATLGRYGVFHFVKNSAPELQILDLDHFLICDILKRENTDPRKWEGKVVLSPPTSKNPLRSIDLHRLS